MNAPTPNTQMFLAMTAWMEARGEGDMGILAVCYAIVNRTVRRGRSLLDIVFEPFQFSAWNTDSPTRLNLDEIREDDLVWATCWEMAGAALSGAIPDPIEGRTLYMNEKVVRRWNGGSLPGWWRRAGEKDKGIIIKRHTFRFDS